MQGESPITLQTTLNLADHGINATAFRFGNLTMESDKYISVKDTAQDGSAQVAVVDMHNSNAINRRPMKAEASLMAPAENIMALKGVTEGQPGHFVQVFNLDTKEKLGVFQSSESIIFWKWISNRTLALVCEKDVYHWKLEAAGSVPEKMFQRGGKLAEAGTQIIAYAVNSQQSWCVLTGISTQDQGRTIDGNMQLYSVEKKQQQLLEGHAGCFGNILVGDNEGPAGLFAFTERKVGTQQTKLHIMDVTKSRGEGAAPFKVAAEIQMPPEAPGDFAVSLSLSEKHGVVYMITKAGFLLVFDVLTGTMLVRTRVSQETVFISTGSATSGGIIFVNKKGAVSSVKVNEASIINYIMNQLVHLPNRQDIAFTLARRFALPGADELFTRQFQQCFASGDYKGAAVIAAQCKSGILRTPQTIEQFKSVQVGPGQPSPVLHYFSTLLEHSKLNALESVELVKPVVLQQRRELVEKWLKEDKLECTEELGDIVRALDPRFSLSIYLRAGVHAKVIEAMASTGQFDQIVAYVKKTGYQADYSQLLTNMIATNPEGATNFAKGLLEGQNGQPLIDVNQVVKAFMDQGRLQETTSILLDALKANRPDQAQLQTQLLAMNLQQAPKVAEAILQMNLFTHYDKKYIGQLCEKAGLMQWAMEHYQGGDTSDLKRVMLHAHTMTPEFLIQYFSKLAPETALECMTDLLRHNRQNLNVVVQVAIKYHEQIGAVKIVEMFDTFGSNEGTFYFLGAILSSSTNSDVHFKYIQAASRVGNMQEVERVCRESTCYDPEAVKAFLIEAKLADPRPLIYVCDLHGHVEELTEYLYKNSLMKYIEVYVVKVNPNNCPKVVGALIDLDCSEDFIKNLLQSVRAACPVGPLVEEIEKRNRLRVLMPWLEARAAEGNQDPHLHNAMAKIYIDTNRDPDTFLKSNAFYDSAVVGKYCEDRDPHLAYTAYKRAWGTCDEQLVNVTNRNGLFRLQARYLVERQSLELWGLVLNPENQHRTNVVDQVVSTALPESSKPEEVSATVKAFIEANIPEKLIELLEKIVFHNDIGKNKNLQDLLVLTAMKADKARVMDYINRLEHYSGSEIAKVALGEPYRLYEEAFLIYKKSGQNAEAMDVLLNNIESLERAQEFAARCNESNVWYKLGKAQLENNQVAEAIDSYLKAEDATDYSEVIQAAEREENYDELISYLVMARNKAKDQAIDTELVYSYAKTDRLGEMEEFVSGTNTANVQAVGDRLYDERAFKAAKILYTSISNNSKLASCHVQLAEYTQAIEAARKANNPRTWKEVNIACVQAEQFRCAEIAGMNIIVHPDHLEELIAQYEKQGAFEALMGLLESGLNNERSHIGMFTELAVLYAKFKPEKLMDFIKLNTAKLNIPKLIQACERHYHWTEAVYLYTHYDEFDAAANTMMAHSPTAFSHDQFQMVMQKVANMELYYRAIQFYLDENPTQLVTMLNAIAAKVDHARVVQQVRKTGHLPLILPYLKHVQQHNIAAVNDAINDLYVDGEQYEDLRESIEGFDNFDQIALAQKLEKHELLEMRRIASLVYKKNKRYKQAMELARADGQYRDAMETAFASGNEDLAEGLLRNYAEAGDKECFAACLYTCYDLIRPDTALELAWRKGMTDYAMPYLIQVLREYTSRVDALDKKTQKREEAEEKEKSASNDFVPDYLMPPMMGPGGLGGFGQLAIGNAPMPQQPGMMQPGMMQPGAPSMMMTPGGF